MEKFTFFPYSWHMDEDEEDITAMRVYGLNSNNENVCVRIDNFTPFVYLELPEHIPWTAGKAQMLGNKIDSLLGDRKPLAKKLMFKKRLYYAHLTPNGKRKTFPYMFVSFSHQSDIRNMSYKIRQPINIMGIGHIKLKMHEQDASPILQFTSYRNISTAGWIDFTGTRIPEDDQITRCKHEFKVKWKHVSPNTKPTVACPLIMGFDIEVNSTNPSAMPKAEKPGDKVFQISCVLFRHGDDESKMDRYLLTLGEPDPKTVGEDTEILMYETEHDLLIGYTQFIQEKNPNIIVGYNILNFDIPYMIERAKMSYCIDEFDQQGFDKYGHAKEKTIKWSSSAYGNQTFQFLDAEGRLYVDLLPLVKRDYKMDNYKLKTISTFFLGSTKDPLSVKGIFKCYRIGIKNIDGVYSKQAQKAMGICGRYCVVDSVLVIRLFNKLQTWIGLCEMARTCNVPIFYLYTQGQQIKVYSQIYKFCMFKNFVVEKDGYIPKDNEHYVGATVFEPIAGVYDRVLPFDFASLYPTTIIAYNIDYSTLVIDPSIPDSDCHVMEWQDCIGCLVKGTKITMGEYSMNIEDLNGYTDQLLAYDGKNGLEYYNQTNFFDQGIKECIELTFNDGSILKCTPDHRLLVNDGNECKWVEAQYVKLHQDKVNTGYSPPVYNISDDVLIIDEYVFRGRALIIFYKLLGLLCTDGHCTKGQTIIYSGHQIDIQNITRDIEYITKDKQSYKVSKCNYGWGIAIKGRFGKILRDLDGMMLGKKSTQIRTLPSILKNTSEGELCAFLSGLMGGDGHTFAFSEKAKSLGCIKISWTSEQENMLVPIFNQLQKYFTKCCIKTSVYRIKNKTFLGIKADNTIKFQEKIGFSYCINKSMRLEAGCSYLRYRDNVWNQQKYIVEKVREFKDNMSIEDAINKVIKEVHENHPIYNKYYASPSRTQMIGLLRPRKKWDKPMFSREHFNGQAEYMKEIGSLHMFDSYRVNIEEKSLPCIQKTVIYKRNIGPQQTYDLEVETSHSFVADGVVVHNCEHDKTIRKTKPKHVMCQKRYFRFLKEPKGVMPTVLQNLLDARAHTRKQKKVIDKILDKKDIDENENKIVEELIPDVLKMLNDKKKIPKCRLDELKTLTEVLEKRQNAYKVSANSMYGAMGVTRGYLPFMPGAMATTAMGRKNIGIVAKTIPEKFGGKLIYGDTDTLLPDTPVLIKRNGKIEYRTMEELSNGYWNHTITGKEISLAEDGILVWSDIGFTPIKYVIRHAITKPLIRVTTHVGSVECTLDHSLLWENGDAAKASDVTIGSKLCISELPLPDDTPEEPLYLNKLTQQKIEDYKIPEIYIYDNMFTAEMAFVWGLFYADGSCGTYKRKEKLTVSTWAINNQDNKLLQRCADILNKHNINGIKFKIIDTMKSSGVNKLVPNSQKRHSVIVQFVEKYRKLFYDCRKSKRVPSELFNYSFKFRQAFFMGYYAGDGSKKDPAITCSNKGAIGSAGLFYLMKSIGYQVSINVRKDKPTIYKLTGSTPKTKFKYPPNAVKKIDPTNIYNSMEPLIKTNYENKPEYIYDIETENHHFAAGVGQLVVHNSNYIVFPHLKTAAENWDHAIHVATEVTKMFPKPICLEFENEIYWRFFILTKKRYMYKKCMRDGVVDEKIGKKGVLLARRDNSMFIRNAYETLIMMVFNRKTREEILFYVIDIINKLCSHFYSYKDFVVTKSIGSHGGGQVILFINEKGQKKGKMGDYTVPLLSTEVKERERQFKLKNCNNPKDYYTRCLPAVVQLAERMRQRGQRVDPGTRLEYVISIQGGHKAKQYVKVEDAIYFSQHSSVLNLDYMYYLKLMTNPFDDVLNVLYNVDDDSKNTFQKDFVLKQYKFRLNVRTKVLEELKDLISPTVTFAK
jgi:DNA polymerase elongation subunit (family B)